MTSEWKEKVDLAECSGNEDLTHNLAYFDVLAARLKVKSLRSFQIQSLVSVMNKKDSFLVLPTGSGKSFCYVLPALNTNGSVIVISPLIALMRDQVSHLSKLDIPSASLDSQFSFEERSEILTSLLAGELKILFISPERMSDAGFRVFLKKINITMFAVDEAHCVHHWGQGFRPEYQRLGKYLEEFPDVPRMALTATVNKKEKIEICLSLGLRDPQVIEVISPRNNLLLNLFRFKSIDERRSRVCSRILELEGQGILYCSTRRTAEEFFNLLEFNGVSTSLYHGGLDTLRRRKSQETFEQGRSRVLVATKAFGMGLNLPNIRFVIHSDMPCSIESYTQEIGRAGRDGLPSICELYYGPKDYFIQKFMIEKDFPSQESFEKVLTVLSSKFEKDSAISSRDLFSSIELFWNIPTEEVEAIFRLLYREDFLEPLDRTGELNWQSCSTWSKTEKGLSLNEILQLRHEQYQWRIDKLKSMHQLVKNGADGIREFIVGYFT